MKKLMAFDNILNYFLAVALILAPLKFRSWISPADTLPEWLFIIIGLGFLFFAMWQTYRFTKGYTEKDMIFSAVMAFIPVIGLTIALIIPLELYLGARIALWIGDIYMVVLGVLYLKE